MGMLSVDTVELTRLAARIRGATAEALALRRRPELMLATGAELASPYLLSGTRDFVGGWAFALERVSDDATRLAEALDVVARLYTDVERANTRLSS